MFRRLLYRGIQQRHRLTGQAHGILLARKLWIRAKRAKMIENMLAVLAAHDRHYNRCADRCSKGRTAMRDVRRSVQKRHLYIFRGNTQVGKDSKALSLGETRLDLRHYASASAFDHIKTFPVLAVHPCVYVGVALLCGDCENLFPASFSSADQNALSVAVCGYEAFARGEAVSGKDLRPIYLRMPQAERERLEREKK